MWLVSARFDLFAFGAPAVFSLILLGAEAHLAPTGALPLGMWIVGILAVDVAHVWSTLHVTYLSRTARRRYRWWLIAMPAVAFVSAAALAHSSLTLFWRCLAYVAVFHFVRQQYGWLKLYQRKEPGLSLFQRRLDVVIIYLATIYPLLWWHTRLPREFSWFIQGDFIALSRMKPAVDSLLGLYLSLFIVYAAAVVRGGRPYPWGKILLVYSTAACWGLGIMAVNSDWGFTVTNVFIHGVPYLAYVSYLRRRGQGSSNHRWWWASLYMLPLCLAYLEEWGWDRMLWHEGGLFFGPTVFLTPVGAAWATAALTTPQLTHYLLDGVIWRGRSMGAAATR